MPNPTPNPKPDARVLLVRGAALLVYFGRVTLTLPLALTLVALTLALALALRTLSNPNPNPNPNPNQVCGAGPVHARLVCDGQLRLRRGHPYHRRDAAAPALQ